MDSTYTGESEGTPANFFCSSNHLLTNTRTKKQTK